MKFTKMQGLGNDYLYINCFEEEVENLSELSIKMSDRHFGIGSDGIILIMPSDVADFKMRIFNADGSEAEMCGNGIRCFGKYVYDNGLTDKSVTLVETLAGIKVLDMTMREGKVELIKVDMGEPELYAPKVPVNTEKERFVSEEIDIDEQVLKVTCVSMGNPHAVTYVDDIRGLKIEEIGPKIERHKLFPRRINTEFVNVVGRNLLEMRVWERGSGETLACGTGACAVLVSSVLNEFCNRKATVRLLGGDLIIEWNEDNNHVYMTGPAVKVFDGIWE